MNDRGEQSSPPGLVSEVGPIVVSAPFTIDELARTRLLVFEAARLAGLAEARGQELVLAVNELVVNVVRHGGGTGTLTTHVGREGLTVEVADTGPGLPETLPSTLPDPGQTSGRGLWLVRTLFPGTRWTSTPRGLTVRVFEPRA
ncbi:ATP-binding protein [Longispora sp. NPDC051575]|uniref:ATP-binding protein n=1 Tax=Longispora sp. NPDC051575 TaxID=3154943 RepID=UPI0034133093